MFTKHKNKIDLSAIASVGESLHLLYLHKLMPLESSYKFHELVRPKMDDADFTGVPMVMLVGQYSTGKTTFIRYLLDQDFNECRIGPEPTTDKFVAIMHGQTSRSIPGNAVVVDPKKPFKSLAKFGNAFLNRFVCSEVNNELCRGLTLIDTPGILSGEKQTQMRGYDFIEVIKTLGERCDLILFLFDAHKLDISDELRAALNALKPHESKIRIILNKADRVDYQALMRVYGALMWSLGKIVMTPEVARVYIGSFWEEAHQYDYFSKLFELEELDLMKCMIDLPSSSLLRKLDGMVSRARIAIANAHVVSKISTDMPIFMKAKKKAEILDGLQDIFAQLHISAGIPVGDFPEINEYRERLKHLDFSSFPKMKQKHIDDVQSMLSIDLPQLMDRIPSEFSSEPEKATLSGGIFTTLSEPKEPKPFNPFGANADTHIKLGGGFEDWIVEASRYKYDEIFESMSPANGKLRGDLAKPYMQQSKLPNIVLMKIWKLSDIDKDGCLDKDEFALCGYLIDIQLNGTEVPQELPKELIPPSKRCLSKLS